MKNYIKPNNFIIIAKSLLFLYIISNSSINFVKSEVINVQRNHDSGGITWTKIDDKNDIKEKLTQGKKKNLESNSFRLVDTNNSLIEEDMKRRIQPIQTNKYSQWIVLD